MSRVKDWWNADRSPEWTRRASGIDRIKTLRVGDDIGSNGYHLENALQVAVLELDERLQKVERRLDSDIECP